MKRQLFPILVFVFITLSCSCFAQQKKAQKKAQSISFNGYWVIESNVKTPKSNTIYFYNNDKFMVYKENVEGMKINLNRRKTLLKLKFALEQAVFAWDSGNKVNNNMLVATAFRR